MKGHPDSSQGEPGRQWGPEDSATGPGQASAAHLREVIFRGRSPSLSGEGGRGLSQLSRGENRFLTL